MIQPLIVESGANMIKPSPGKPSSARVDSQVDAHSHASPCRGANHFVHVRLFFINASPLIESPMMEMPLECCASDARAPPYASSTNSPATHRCCTVSACETSFSNRITSSTLGVFAGTGGSLVAVVTVFKQTMLITVLEHFLLVCEHTLRWDTSARNLTLEGRTPGLSGARQSGICQICSLPQQKCAGGYPWIPFPPPSRNAEA